MYVFVYLFICSLIYLSRFIAAGALLGILFGLLHVCVCGNLQNNKELALMKNHIIE